MSSVSEHSPHTAVRPIPLRNGDVLDQTTFHARYLATQPGFRAELIGGVVHAPSPVTNWHSEYHYAIVGWLYHYQAHSPGVKGGDNGTVILDDENEPQPDAFLRLEEAVGGYSRVSEEGYIVGPPELHIEVAYSSASIDLHQKRREYERTGVGEYVVVLVEEQSVRAFRREEDAYVDSSLDAQSVWRSSAFPGLWLDTRALFNRDATRLLATLDKGLATDEHRAFVTRLSSLVDTDRPR